MAPMKRAVLLGCGLYGAKVATLLAESKLLSSLVVADFALQSAKAVAASLDNKGFSVSAEQVDASDEGSIRALLKGADLLLNITGAYEKTALPAVRAAIAAGVNYIDINANFETTRQVLDLDAAARQAGVSVLIGFGDVPGLINLVAKMGAAKLDEVEEIHLAAGGANVHFLAPAMERLWQNVWSAPYVYQDGKYVQVPACSGKESIRLPGVDEELPVMASVNLPLITLPRFFPGVKLVTFKTGIGPAETGNDLIAALFKWGFNSHEPIEVKGVKIAPADFAPAFLGSAAHANTVSIGNKPGVSGYQVRVVGKKNGQPASYTYQFRDTRYAMTQNICVLAAEMLMDGRINQKGVLAAEAVAPEPFIQMALKNGIVMREISECSL